MDEKDIRKYAELMKELDLTVIELDSSGNVVRLERAPGESVSRIVNTNIETAGDMEPVVEDTEKKIPDGVVEITSPLVGVFYSAPAEDAEPFVQKGSRVKKGDVLCVIESMKLMNEILSEYDGIITEVVAVDKQVVDFGYPLFMLKEE